MRRSNAAFNRRDRSAAFADFHPDVEWRDLQHDPDTPECIHGRSALLAIWDRWEEVFDDFTAEIEDYIDAGESVVTVTRWRATGKGSALVAVTVRWIARRTAPSRFSPSVGPLDGVRTITNDDTAT